jgi:hypothetical protein
VVDKLPGLTPRISFIVRDVFQFRIGVRSGSQLKSANFSYRTTRPQ